MLWRPDPTRPGPTKQNTARIMVPLQQLCNKHTSIGWKCYGEPTRPDQTRQNKQLNSSWYHSKKNKQKITSWKKRKKCIETCKKAQIMFHFCPSVNHKTKARILIHIQSSILVGGDKVPAKFDKCPVSFCRLNFLEFIETKKSIRKISKYLSFFGVYLDKLDK